MGIPKQVMDAETEAERELDEIDRAGKAGEKITIVANQSGKEPTNPSKPTPAPAVVEQTPEPPKAEVTEAPKMGLLSAAAAEHPVEDLEQLRRDAEKWRQREKSEEGRCAKVNEEWRVKCDALQKEIAGLNAQLEARAAQNLRTPDGNLSDESKKQLRAFLGEDYSDTELENFAKAARMVVGNPAQEVTDILAERDRKAAEVEANDSRKRFMDKLRAEYPEFVRLDAENDPRLMAFYKTSIGGVMRGKTYSDVAIEALQALDYPTFALVVQEFAKSAQLDLSSNGNPAKGADAQARPANRQSSRTDTKQPRRVPRSEIAQFRKKAFSNRAEDYYGLTSKQVEEQLRFYEEAEENDRVDEEL